MGVNLNKTFSASTALILLDNTEIGELQNLSVSEEYNVIPVNQMGSSLPVAFVPGVYKGTVKAKRALLEIDKVFQVLAPGTDVETVKHLIDQILPGGSSVIQPALDLNDLIKRITNFFSAKTKAEPFSQVITFTIKVLDADNHEQMRLERCVLTGRTLTLDVGGIVIMQDLSIIYQKRAV